METSQVLSDLQAIAAERDGFSFGELWRYDKDAVTAVLPIIRGNGFDRGYITTPEAGENLKMSDTGNISKVRVENKTDRIVLMRTGEIIAGGTQERALIKSNLIPANVAVEVEVHCVNASRPITTDSPMKYSGSQTPSYIRSSFYSGGLSQNETWHRTTAYSASMASPSGLGLDAETPSVGFAGFSQPSDDLLRVQQDVKRDFGDIIKAVPHQDGQVGIVLISLNGPEGAETFDNRDSYNAVREALLEQDASTIGRASKDTDNVFQFKPERAKEQARSLLTQGYQVTGDEDVFSLESERFVGEAVYLNSSLIYLSLLKR